LPGYYTTPTVRDNYQGIARYLAAVGDRQRDLVVLNAPGQQEVWRYYDPGLPVLALPQQRPADPAAVEAALQQATADRRHVYALFWATAEADPQQQVERWLDLHAFKTLDSWQGTLRFVVYTLADDLQPVHREPVRWENGIVLTGIEQAGHLSQQVEPGSAALVRLWWRAEQPLERRYKVSLQLLDGGNQVVAQHDSEPAGGTLPTDRWRAGERVADNHGVAIPFGVPPGTYRLAVVLYDGESGTRLRQGGQELAVLGEVTVVPTGRSVPAEVLPMLQRTQRWLGPVQLVGYDLYRRGFAHAPQTAVEPGDTVSLTLYWQAPDPLPASWPELLFMTVQLGGESLRVPLAGDGYPTGAWPPGALVRNTVDLVYTGAARQPVVTVDGVETVLQPLPVR
jgi:mannosyltransferase